MRMTPSCATWSRWSGAFSRDGGGPGRGVFHPGASGRGLSAGWGFWIGSGALRCVLFVCGREVSAASTLLTCAFIGRPFAGEKTWGVQEPPRSPDAYPEPRLCGSIYRFCGCRRGGISVGWHSGVPVARRFGTSGAFDSQPPAQRGSTHSWHPGPGAPQSVSSSPHPRLAQHQVEQVLLGVHAQLGVEVSGVAAHGVLADAKVLGYVALGAALADE